MAQQNHLLKISQRKTPLILRSVLIIGESSSIFLSLKSRFERRHIKCVLESDLTRILYRAENHSFDMVLIDYDFPKVPGLTVVQRVEEALQRSDRQAVPILFVTSNRKVVNALDSQNKIGIQDFIMAPFDHEMLLTRFSEKKHAISKNLLRRKERDAIANSLKENKSTKSPIGLFDDIRRNCSSDQEALQIFCDLVSEQDVTADLRVALSELSQKFPNNLNVVNLMAKILIDQGSFSEAHVMLDKSGKLIPPHVERMNRVVKKYIDIFDSKKATHKLASLIAADHFNPDIKYTYFSRALDAGIDDSFLVEALIENSPCEVVRYFNNRGVTESKAKRYAESRQCYTMALEFYPKYRDRHKIYYNLAMLSLKQSDFSESGEASSFLEKSLNASPGYKKASRLLERLKDNAKLKST